MTRAGTVPTRFLRLVRTPSLNNRSSLIGLPAPRCSHASGGFHVPLSVPLLQSGANFLLMLS